MTEMHVPAHITLTRRIAQQEAAAVTALTVEEQQLKTEYDKHQAEYEAERARLDAELREAAAKAKAHLDNLAAAGQMLNGQVQDVGRRLRQHSDEATDAQQTVLDWCTRRGINVTDLPPLRDTGPMPAIPAPRSEVVDLAPHVGHDVVLRTFGGTKIGGRLVRVSDRAQVRQDDGTDCYVAVTDVAEVMRVAEIPPPPGFDTSAPLVVTADPLPAIGESDALLEAGRRAANPNTDPGATRVDTGGDQPAEGPFPGGVESPAGPRPKRPRRRPQSSVNERDGDDHG